ncbi:MAG TPA: DUF58 domain-containing protein [Longimicrobiales bacterium]
MSPRNPTISDIWRRVRRAFRPPRRLRMLRPGIWVIAGTLALGLATLNTGNNLLYLLMGALLGMIALSGWLSESTLRDVQVRRSMPMAVTAGEPVRIEYRVTNGSGRRSVHALEIREVVGGQPVAGNPPGAEPEVVPAYLHQLEPGAAGVARAQFHARRRGVYRLEGVTLATSFPFGLFSKERDLECRDSLTVWPRTDRPVRPPAPAGRQARRARIAERSAAGAGRGDYRGLREYRSGDDPRDIHWRSTARRGELITREYEQDAADEYWIVLDTGAPDEASGEAAVETAAALVVGGARRGDRCGLAAGPVRIPPGVAAGTTESLLDVLAAVGLSVDAPRPAPPARAAMCLLVSARGPDSQAWGDVFVTSGDA